MDIIEIGQGGVGILEAKSDESIAGLCTKDLATCVAIILKNEERISLIHYDGTSSVEKIFTEIDLMGKDFECSFVINPLYCIGSFEKGFKISSMKQLTECADDEYSVVEYLKEKLDGREINIIETGGKDCFAAVLKDGSVMVNPNDERISKLTRVSHPKSQLRYEINELNRYLSKRYSQELDLQFDEGKWTEMPECVDFVKYFIKEKDEDVIMAYVLCKFQQLFDMKIEDILQEKGEMGLGTLAYDVVKSIKYCQQKMQNPSPSLIQNNYLR